MTSFEVSLHLDAFADQHEADYRTGLVLAWHTAALAGAAFSGKLPSLRKLLGEVGTKQVDGEAAARLQARHERFIKEMG